MNISEEQNEMEKVVVLMSTYNGEKYLRNQIDSLIDQEGVEVEILVRDDGSSDDTIKILEEYKKNRYVKLEYYLGKNMGPARSFLDLMKHAQEADYYALCDQDDTWLSDKLKIAVDSIKRIYSKAFLHEIPVLYYGMPRFADNDGNLLKGPKGIYEKSLDFPSCLIKSNSTGCTMVFNRKLLEIINSKTPGSITMHDEWLHKVCLALGGQIVYDEDVHILYRQHGGNTIGGQLSIMKVIKRYLKTMFRPDCIRSKCISSLVECYGPEMAKRNVELAKKVQLYNTGFINKWDLMLNKEIRTEYFKRNLLFKLAVLFGIF